MDSDRFDIVAKAADADLDANGMMTYPQFMLRLQSLLEDRFKMVTRWEKRELPVYALVVVAEGKLGPKLKVPPGNAIVPAAARRRRRIARPLNCGTRMNMTPTGGKVTGCGIWLESSREICWAQPAATSSISPVLSGSLDLSSSSLPNDLPTRPVRRSLRRCRNSLA